MKGLWYKLALFAGIVVMCFAASCAKADPEKAEKAAKEYAKHIKGTTGEVSCARSDSDGDGYVTCTLFMEEGEPMGAECGAQKYCGCNCAEGCKPLTHKIRGR